MIGEGLMVVPRNCERTEQTRKPNKRNKHTTQTKQTTNKTKQNKPPTKQNKIKQKQKQTDKQTNKQNSLLVLSDRPPMQSCPFSFELSGAWLLNDLKYKCSFDKRICFELRNPSACVVYGHESPWVCQYGLTFSGILWAHSRKVTTFFALVDNRDLASAVTNDEFFGSCSRTSRSVVGQRNKGGNVIDG